jgi:hypothetical protein
MPHYGEWDHQEVVEDLEVQGGQEDPAGQEGLEDHKDKDKYHNSQLCQQAM